MVEDPDGQKPVAGQFYMLWVPEVDEIPMSVAFIGRQIGFAVQNVGEATSALHRLGKGDVIGLRGPYGKGFTFNENNNILAVGGGTGIAPIAALIESTPGPNFKVVVGARTAGELLYIERLEKTGAELFTTTDDGTAGRKGFATELALEIIEGEHIDLVLSCGPEAMLKKIVDACNEKNIPAQVSLERFMKCGVGLCDSCAICGKLVCKDGPVFHGNEVAKFEEFGKIKRGPSGRIERL
jgi:dihydroorotate dehydrogenase electron transfer subunit